MLQSTNNSARTIEKKDSSQKIIQDAKQNLNSHRELLNKMRDSKLAEKISVLRANPSKKKIFDD